MSATRSAIAAGCAVLAACVVSCGGPAADPAGSAVPTSTAPVVRTDITARRELIGTLTFAGTYTVINQLGPGTYTSLPAAGSTVARGQTLYRVDDRPVTLLYGAPEWRSLTVGVSDGTDVRQLELNLLALGFANSTNLIANGHFDWFDAAAVRRWQASLGVAQTGAVGFGDVVYEGGPIRIESVRAGAGAPADPNQEILDATSTRPEVDVELDTTEEGSITAGDAVQVTLPDGTTIVPGHVTSVGTVATAAPSGSSGPGGGPSATVPLAITLDRPDAAAGFDLAPVSVGVVVAVHRGVLAVPVTALMAQPGGGFAVEVVSGSLRRAVDVSTGLYDESGLVEVTSSDLHEGTLVEVPHE